MLIEQTLVTQAWMAMSKVLLVEDDAAIAQPLLEWLEADGFTVEHASSAEDALQLLVNFQYDIIVLDRGLPAMSGGDMLRKHRQAGGVTPIIFLTGETALQSKKDGLNSGADDYLTKPFEPEELSARIRAILRRPPALIPDILKVGNVSLDARSQSVTVDGEQVVLPKREYAVLEFLMRNLNRHFSSQDLVSAVWESDSDGSEDAVRSCVKRLRKKLTDKNGQCILATVPGAGYTIKI